MKNNKGFTLIELLAVIALLSILTLLVTPAIFKVRKNVISNTLESKIGQIIIAAEDYASDNIMEIPSPVENTCSSGEACKYAETSDCLIVIVKSLISQGYLIGDKDEKEVLVNPIDGSYLNNEKVCIKYTDNDVMNRKAFAYIINEDKITNWDSERYK